MGKAVIVSGGTRGIGREIAKKVIERGGDVIVTYRANEQAAEDMYRELLSNKSSSFVHKMNVANEADVAALFQRIENQDIQIDGLVNNAGVTADKMMHRMGSDDWDQVVDVNLKGSFLMAREFIKRTLRSRRIKKIINMSSVSGLVGIMGQANYSASKAGMMSMTRTIAKEYSKFGFVCNTVAPGYIETDMLDGLNVEKIKKTVPLGRLGEAHEVAELSWFLLSDQSNYITGQTFIIDGGLTI